MADPNKKSPITAKATVNYVWIVRDAPEDNKGKMYVSTAGRDKPHTGVVVSVGKNVKDMDIKNSVGRKAIFHPTVGWTIEYKGVDYTILTEEQIIGVDD